MEQPQMQPQKGSNTTALIGLILGIISVVFVLFSFCFFQLVGGGLGLVLGITALILGLVAKKQIREQGSPSSQGKMATAALILGIIGTVLGLISLAVGIIMSLVLAGPAIQNIFDDIINNLNQ